MRVDQSENYGFGQFSTSLQEVLSLIELLYSSKDPDQQAMANSRLLAIQSSPEVWEICWQLLNPDAGTTEEVQFFAANSIVLKINQTWSQMPESWVQDELRPKLFDILCNYARSDKGYKLVTDRLALGLATLAVHSIPSFWPNAIEQIMQALMPTTMETPVQTRKYCDILFKILSYIPEEYSILIPQQDDRAKLNYNMTQAGPVVFRFLHSLLVSTDRQTVASTDLNNVLKCLTSWTLHSQTSLLELDSGIEILNVIYNMIPDREYCSNACAALAATFSTQKADSYKNTVMEFIPKIAGLRSTIEAYKNEDDMDCVIKVYSLVVNFAENHCRLFLKIILDDNIVIRPGLEETLKRDILRIIEVILECSAAPGTFSVDEKYSEITFPFWFSFLENFYYYSDSYNERICEIFNPLVDMLLVISLRKLRYPSSKTYNEVWSDDQRETFRCYRQDLGDNISLLINFPRSRSRILGKLNEQFTNALNLMTQREPMDGERPWQDLEAALFSLKSIAEAVPFDEVQHVPSIFTSLSQIPFNDSQILLFCTTCEMISAFSDWLYAHGTYLASALNILFKGIMTTSKDMRLFSTLALKDLTSECQAVLHPYALQIVNSCSEAIHQPGLDITTCEKARLMHAIGTSLPMCPAGLVTATLSNVTAPLMNDLRATINNKDPQLEPMRRSIVLDRLTMINSLIEAFHVKQSSGNDYEADGDENDPRLDFSRFEMSHEVNITEPALSLLSEFLPLLSEITIDYKDDCNIIEIVTSTTKRCCRSLGTDLRPLLQDLLKLIVLSYEPAINPQLLDALFPLFNLFGKDSSVQSSLQDGFSLISERTVLACLNSPLRNLSMTIEIYFRLASSVCKKFTDFLTYPRVNCNVELIYKLAVESLELPEKRTLGEVCSFLQQFRAKSIGVDQLHRIMLSNLELLLSNIFKVMGGVFSTPRNAVEHVVDLFFAIIDADEVREPLKAIAEQRPNFPTNYVSVQQKTSFVQRVMHERNRRKFKDLCNEFVLMARNLHRN